MWLCVYVIMRLKTKTNECDELGGFLGVSRHLITSNAAKHESHNNLKRPIDMQM